jgi:hypothetical protein
MTSGSSTFKLLAQLVGSIVLACVVLLLLAAAVFA